MSNGRLFNSLDPDLDEVENQETDFDNPEDELSLEEQFDEELAEAEHRFNLGNYYRVLVKGGIFKDGSEAAKVVDAEVRAFARERMAVLLNLPSAPKPKVELPFSDEQIQVLKWLADRYYEKQQQSQGPANPVVQAPAPPQAQQPTVVAKPTIPQITPLAAPPKSGALDTRMEQKPRKTRQPKQKIDYSVIADGVTFEENGKHWKFVTNPETGKRLKMGVSLKRQVTPPHKLPMPAAQDMANLSAMQAQHQVLQAPVVQTEKTRIG